ncbi:phosphatase PAP2 family protein [Candidatus Uhrbacteria bacterium]|nr:phosphatase PAP2 family protein [Candidatus Uhrbacteria bacterium]
MDLYLFRLINNLAGQSAVLDWAGRFFASGLLWAMMFVLLILFARRSRPAEERHEFATVLVAGLAGLGAFVTNTIISWLYFRPRPFVAFPDVHLLIAKDAAEKSFPSDHAAIAFALALAVFLAHRKLGYLFLALATLVALGRVFVGVHFPSDALAGAVVGIFWGAVTSRWGRKLFENLLSAHRRAA